MITDKQKSYILGLVAENKEFIQFMGGNVWETDYPDIIKWLQIKFPAMTFTDDINDLTVNEASFLISYLKNV